MTSVRRSLAFAFLDRYASTVVAIVSSIVLARLLTPDQIGVYAVTMALLAFATTVRDMGAGQYLLQEKELTDDRIRAVWAIQLGIGALLGLVVALASWPLGRFYAAPGMTSILLVLSINFLVNPLGSVTYAWLMREMRYDAVAVMRFTSSLTGAVVSIFFAARGHGPISLAYGSVAGTAANSAVSVFFRPPHYPWLPGLREIRRVMAFGSRVTSSSILGTVASGAPEFLLGKLQGLVAVGYYSRAQGLVSLFGRLVIDVVYSVALSMFAKESREARDSSASFLRALSYVCALTWAFAAGLAFLAFPTIRLLYGTQWDDSTDIARVLAAATSLGTLIPVCTAALIGAGAVKSVFRASLVSSVVMIVFAAFGASQGTLGLAAAVVVASALCTAQWLREAQRVVGFSMSALLATFGRSAGVAALSSVGPAVSFLVFGARPEAILLPLTLGIVAGVLGFLVGLRVLAHPLAEELVRLLPAAGRVLPRAR